VPKWNGRHSVDTLSQCLLWYLFSLGVTHDYFVARGIFFTR